MTKKLIFSVILLLAFAVGNSYSQNKDSYKNLDPSAKATKMADRMKKSLNLTDSQYKSVYDVFYNHLTEMSSTKGKYEKGSDEFKSYRKEKREELKKSLSGILTSDQIKTMEENRQKHKDKRKEKGKNKDRKKDRSKDSDSSKYPEKR